MGACSRRVGVVLLVAVLTLALLHFFDVIPSSYSCDHASGLAVKVMTLAALVGVASPTTATTTTITTTTTEVDAVQAVEVVDDVVAAAPEVDAVVAVQGPTVPVDDEALATPVVDNAAQAPISTPIATAANGSAVSVAKPDYSGVTDADVLALFAQYQVDFGKSYATDAAKAKGLAAFNASLARITYQNKVDTATYGLTKFSDVPLQEFWDTHLMSEHHGKPVNYNESQLEAEYGDTGAGYYQTTFTDDCDWRFPVTTCGYDKTNVLTPVVNQNECGGCWAYSAVATIESRFVLDGYDITKLSVSQILDCDECACACLLLGLCCVALCNAHAQRGGCVRLFARVYPYTPNPLPPPPGSHSSFHINHRATEHATTWDHAADYGCGGGDTTFTLEHYVQDTGLWTAKDYPDTAAAKGITSACPAPSAQPKVRGRTPRGGVELQWCRPVSWLGKGDRWWLCSFRTCLST
jgi:hypothetical protein